MSLKSGDGFLKHFNALFLLSIALILASHYLLFPSLWDLPYAEVGQIFLKERIERGFLASLFSGDFTHLALLPRLIVGVSVWFGVEHFPVVQQSLTSLLLAFAASFICLNTFRSLISNDWVRFCFALALGLYPSYENMTSLNAAYLLVPFVLLLSVGDFSRVHWTLQTMMALLAFLIVASKSAMIVLFPGLAAALAVAWRLKRRGSVITLCFLLLGVTLGTLKTALTAPDVRVIGAPIPEFWTRVEYSFHLTAKALGSVFVSISEPKPWSALFWMSVFFGAAITVFHTSRTLAQHRERPALVLLGGSVFALLGVSYLFTISPVYIPEPLSWSNPMNTDVRALSLSHPAAVLLLFVICACLEKRKQVFSHWLVRLIAFLMVVHAVDRYRSHRDPFEVTQRWQNANWSEARVCVGINPKNWTFCAQM